MWLPLAVMISGASMTAPAGVEPPGEQQDLGTTEPRKERSKRFTLGAGAAAMPQFYGSDDYKTDPALLVDVQVGRFFAKTGEGIGFNVIKNDTFAAGVTLNWIQGYDADEVPAGINEVDDALGARLFASARVRGMVATLAGTQAVTESDRGLLINANLAYSLRPTQRLTIMPSLGATWADEDYLISYFGIDSFEAAASGLGAYQPIGSGFRDVSFRVAVNYQISKKLSIVGAAGVMHLLDKAADSPLVERQTNPIGLLGLTYTFGQ
jgi:outer membrane protein